MNGGDGRLILWAGPKHSGKTTAVTRLVEAVRREGFTVGGFLAPSIYRDKQLVGFDILDLRDGRRARLAERRSQHGDVGGFTFCDRGMELGRQALRSAVQTPVDLVVVDEFGPLELEGRGWRSDVDALLGCRSPVLLLVVRNEVVPSVEGLYHDCLSQTIAAADPHAASKVSAVLAANRNGVADRGAM